MSDELDNLEGIPVLEFPALNGLIDLGARVSDLEKRLDKFETLINDAKKVEGTVLSGFLPGGAIHDRLAEVRAAVKELTDPTQPHHAAAQAALRLNWGALAVEEG